MKAPFWEESYRDDNIFTFGNEPNYTLVELLNLFDRSFHVLDVGCGDGKNSLYMSKQGFSNVDAFDISLNAIAKLKRIASKENININDWTDDLPEFIFKKQ